MCVCYVFINFEITLLFLVYLNATKKKKYELVMFQYLNVISIKSHALYTQYKKEFIKRKEKKKKVNGLYNVSK